MMNTKSEMSDLLVFSHLRWDYLYQRPHHILSRQAKTRRVFYFEEPVFGMTELPRLHLKETPENVLIVIPYLPSNIEESKIERAMSDLLNEVLYEEEIIDYSLLYYSAKAYAFSKDLEPRAVMVDCMEELPSGELMEELLKEADLVFTASHSLYEESKHRHKNIHPLPSALDVDHFSQGRQQLVEPDDQIHLTHPRIGFYGVINEKFDFDLLMKSAELRPDYQFVIAGPVENLDTRKLPRRKNVHYLGKKDYHVLPLYLAGWDCTILPLVVNESTRHLSPVKLLEFLSAAKPVISTELHNLVQDLRGKDLVRFAATPEHFVQGIDNALTRKDHAGWLTEVDQYLEGKTWDRTFHRMLELELKLQDSPLFDEQAKIIHPIILQTTGP